jgi:hypothetical protein
LKQNKKNNQNRSFRPHVAKTKEERIAYGEKVKFADTEGETTARPATRTSTLSAQSVYGRTSNAGIPDREPIRPPQEKESGVGAKVGLWVEILTVAGMLIGATVWLTTLDNKVDFTEGRVSQLNTSIGELDSKREDLCVRVVKLEQWKDVFSDDLKRVRQDINSGVSERDVEAKLAELEKRILKHADPNHNAN